MFADDTTLPVLDPGRGRTKTARIWCDDRPWAGPTHPIAAYIYSEDRKDIRPAGHLAPFRGMLQVDGLAGFKRLALDRADSSVALSFCWARMRRPCYDFWVSTKSPLAAVVLAKIGELYAVEAEIRGHPAEAPDHAACSSVHIGAFNAVASARPSRTSLSITEGEGEAAAHSFVQHPLGRHAPPGARIG